MITRMSPRAATRKAAPSKANGKGAKKPRLPRAAQQALSEFQRRVLELFPDDVLQIVLYGSYARGDAQSDSDVDVMVVVNWQDPEGIKKFYEPNRNDPRYAKLMDTGWEISLKRHVDLSVRPMPERDFNSDNPLAGEAKREGKVLWRKKGWKMADVEEEHPAKPREPKTWIALAEQKLESARKNFKMELHHETVSLAYYSMFYATRAALLSRGLYLIKHSAAADKFSQYFIKTGLVDQKYSQYLGKAQQDREDSDYKPYIPVSSEDARTALTVAEEFLSKVKELIASQDPE